MIKEKKEKKRKIKEVVFRTNNKKMYRMKRETIMITLTKIPLNRREIIIHSYGKKN